MTTVIFHNSIFLTFFQANIVHLLTTTQHTSDLNKIRDALFPNLPTFIGHLIATTILLFIIIRFVYTPFRQAQTRKHKYLTKVIADANKKLINAEMKKDEIYQEYETTNSKCKALINDAIESAAVQKNKIITDAKQKSSQIIDRGDRAVINERRKLLHTIHNQIIDNAFIIAERIANEKIKQQDNKKLIDDFIKDLNLDNN